MDTHQINSLLLKVLPPEVFLGVHSADALPEPTHQRPFCFVSNTHCKHYPGEHWTAFYADEHGGGHYFDSFGYKPPHPEWITYLQKHSPLGVDYFPHRIQPYTSQTCGHFCIFYLANRYKYNVLQCNDNTLMRNVNDAIVQRYVKKLRKKKNK